MRSRRIERAYLVDDESFSIGVYLGRDAERERCEARLIEAGVHLPLTHRSEWARLREGQESWFVYVQDADERYVCGFAVVVGLSRALPGHLILRAERFGAALSNAARRAGLLALLDLVRENSLVLRADVEVFSPAAGVRDSVAAFASALGFRRRERPRSYQETVAVDLRPSEEEVLASFHATARRHIRAVGKNPTAVAVLDHIGYAPRMESLWKETLRRTGGSYQSRDWARLIDFSAARPQAARLLGLFRTDFEGPESLLAFATGYAHGDHVQYAEAASTRQTDLRMPLSYALAWDLMRWGKSVGAHWFDFGGITAGSFSDEGDRLGGVSDFKRYFSKGSVRVGEEWTIEPRPLRAAVASVVTAAAGMLRKSSS